MTSLLDIGPLTEEVAVGGKTVTVHGVTPEGFFYLLAKFPALAQLLGGKGTDMAALQELAPTSVAYALAVATTDRSKYATTDAWKVDVERAAAVAVNLPAHFQIEIFQVAVKLTFPDGLGPFMKAVEALATSINKISGQPQRAQTAPDTTSSKPLRSGFSTDSVGMRLGPAAPSESSVH